MIFNKDTEVVKVEGFAEAYYSNATAFGKVFVPKEKFEQNKEKFESLEFGVHELDGKHSYTEGELSYKLGTIETFALEEENYSEVEQDESDVLIDICSETFNIGWGNFTKLNNKINGLSKKENITIKLTEDTIIEGIKIPEGTEISYTKVNLEKLKDFEFELEL